MFKKHENTIIDVLKNEFQKRNNPTDLESTQVAYITSPSANLFIQYYNL